MGRWKPLPRKAANSCHVTHSRPLNGRQNSQTEMDLQLGLSRPRPHQQRRQPCPLGPAGEEATRLMVLTQARYRRRPPILQPLTHHHHTNTRTYNTAMKLQWTISTLEAEMLTCAGPNSLMRNSGVLSTVEREIQNIETQTAAKGAGMNTTCAQLTSNIENRHMSRHRMPPAASTKDHRRLHRLETPGSMQLELLHEDIGYMFLSAERPRRAL